MRITVFGTGSVGRAVAGKLDELGHEVTLGTRGPVGAGVRSDRGSFANPSLHEWLAERPTIVLTTLADGAAGAELVVNATNGAGSLEALESAGEANLDGKIVLDIANPLDGSRGMPPTLSVSNTDSLGEQIQRRFPQALVVKALNTINVSVMVEPGQLADGNHTSFVSGDNPAAKAIVTELLASIGWSDVIDLGDITTARGPEMYLALWLRLMMALGTPTFSIKVVR